MCQKQRITDLRLFCLNLSHFRFTHFLRKVIGKNYGWRKDISLLCTGHWPPSPPGSKICTCFKLFTSYKIVMGIKRH